MNRSSSNNGRRLSQLGGRFRNSAGTYQLMADLGAAAERPGSLMLGGGNPARIAQAEAVFCRELRRLADDGELVRRWASSYSAPEGDLACRDAIAELLRAQYGWAVSRANIALTPGSQTAFFMLFNAFAGPAAQQESRCVWLPLTPEYVGYADVGVHGPVIRGTPAQIHELGDNLFKYQLARGALDIPGDAGAVCLSRPTNPTGNVVTGEELALVDEAARRAGVPLILDCAYGLPFPSIVYVDAQPFWNENVILCLSLSKLGLPGLRTGIVVASEDVIELLGSMMATMNLAPPSVGATMIEGLIRSGEILSLAQSIIRPHYQARARQTLDCLREAFAGLDWRVHVPEGAFFVWIWFPNLPVASWELYERLKARGVFVLSGHHFFPSMPEDSAHWRECIRVSYAQPLPAVKRGLQVIAEEIRSLHER